MGTTRKAPMMLMLLAETKRGPTQISPTASIIMNVMAIEATDPESRMRQRSRRDGAATPVVIDSSLPESRQSPRLR